ncbi:hypothetical protein PUV54_03430 [Hyphococcus flavus]|uniref:Tetratricopeptide repeat protein n=1 Tax=Hyphococcus flavus TaxID=1866326 RepID=A0AAE9ZCF0_9PROT|nr:hypothetical protein [Hyphococcus flavus]WDI32244.1 hypothetical protein PUV54_03430 [Hyphococcus flavus]
MRGNYRNLCLTAAASVSALLMTGVTTAPAYAQQSQCDAEEGGPSATLSPRIGLAIQDLYVMMQEERWAEALAGFNELIANRGDGMSAYERSTVLELRANVKVNMDNYRGALQDMQAALNANGLPPSRNNQLRYFIAQLNFQMEDYQTAISGLNQWIRTAQQCGVSVDPNAYYLLGAAYVSINPPNYNAAESPIEQALAGSTESRKNYYDLANLVYSELRRTTKRIDLLERMINLWPGEKSYWTQLSGAYSQTNRDREAFSVLEVAYRAGLLDSESEIITLVQYYSFFENPYRGAVMLDREMNAGNVDRDQDNLILLSQLWSQAREHKRSIPILREAARASGDGELFYRLGQVLLADEQYSAAQTALQNALNRGGLESNDTGDAWLLLGTARFSQAGPSDTGRWRSARQAFRNAQRYRNAAQRASEWIAYINAVENTYWDGLDLDYQQRMEECVADIARFERDRRIRDLQNREDDPAELQREQERIAECEALEASGLPSRQRNSSGGDASSEDDNQESAPAEDESATNEE